MSDITNLRGSLLARAIRAVHRSWGDRARDEARRETASMLHGLDDRALADIGLNRRLIDPAVFAGARPISQ